MQHGFIIHTLIDITRTIDRGDASTKNFHTLINALGLHFQPFHDSYPTAEERDLADCRFGSDFAGGRRVWRFPFWIENNAVAAVEVAVRSLNHMPVIGGEIKEIITDAADPGCNTVFRQAFE